MNILICGKNSPYLNNLAERLKREKNEIHFISGSKASEKAGNSVFQQFDFEYTNPNIGRIVKNAKPEVMILLGATDRNFTWYDPVDDAMSFVSGMSSLAMAAKGAGVRRIIFVSGISVLESNRENILNGTVPSQISTMNDAFIHVESFLQSLEDEDLETIILRLPFETGFYDISVADDYCLMAAQKYISGDKLSYAPENYHATMFYMDAVEAIIKTFNYSKPDGKRIFQLQGVIFTEQEYVDALLKTEFNKNCVPEPVLEKNYTPSAYADLEESDEEELGFSVRFGLNEIAEKMCRICLAYKKQAEQKDKRKLHVLPLLESIAAAALATVLMFLLRKTWVGDSFSLFTLYTLLFGAVYGTTYGLFSAVLATIGMLIIQWNDVGLINTIENYAFFLGFLHLVLVGVIAGYVRDKFVRKTTTLNEERNYLSQEVADLTRINDNNIYVKNVYEKRLVGYENSLPRLYELTSQLDYMEPENVIFHATLVAQSLLEVEDVAIYSSTRQSSYFRLAGANSQQAISLGKSIKYDEDSFLYSSLELGEVYKNTKMDPAYPSFAGAVMDGDRINAIIMVWTRDLHKVNQYESDMLAIVCRLIEKSMSRATLYDDAVHEENYVEGTRIMKEEAFLKRFQNYLEGRRLGVFDFSLLRLEAEGEVALKAQTLTRESDVLGIANEVLYMVLPFSNRKDVIEHVVQRFENNGITVVPVGSERLEHYIEEKLPELEEESKE